MTKTKAIEAMKFGNKVTHRFFTKDEYIYMDYNLIHTEDGCSLTVEEFFKWRVLPAWDYGWKIWKAPTKDTLKEAKPGTGIELITKERLKQIQEFGPSHDREFKSRQLINAAIFALTDGDNLNYKQYRWTNFQDNVVRDKIDPIENLVKAGALIAAEIDRIINCQYNGEPYYL